jgi:ribosome-binding factor A
MTNRRLLARMRELCAELGPDDGVDPRTLKKSTRTHNPKRLAGPVARAVREALAASNDPLLLCLWVAEAVPDPDTTRFRIVLHLMDPDVDPDAVTERLRVARGWVRSEVAHCLQRRKAPDLRFTVEVP